MQKTRFYAAIKSKPNNNNNNLFALLLFCATLQTQLFRLTFEYHLLCISYIGKHATTAATTTVVHIFIYEFGFMCECLRACVCVWVCVFSLDLRQWMTNAVTVWGFACVRLTHLSGSFAQRVYSVQWENVAQRIALYLWVSQMHTTNTFDSWFKCGLDFQWRFLAWYSPHTMFELIVMCGDWVLLAHQMYSMKMFKNSGF